ncbi:GNAT family N-acetyltransferase [Mesorhizobium sp. LSJC265A00]|uniref:GNAT family N-acetyltransferase n=1 Tax=Mesorhizobium sp. LSJC265A00 TaxID=1287322 RepID=UPI0018DE90E6|nr:GNAT family N-acetyltransferase [Mesorhizobium sp. LSJC265A00]
MTISIEPTAHVVSWSQLSDAEQDDIASFIEHAGEVEIGVRERAADAKAFFLLKRSSALIGCAALKCPPQARKQNVFAKAKCALDPTTFTYELGWIVVATSERRKGLSRILVNSALETAGPRPIYATCRADNIAMRRVLVDNAFAEHGQSYLGRDGRTKISLLLRDASPVT